MKAYIKILVAASLITIGSQGFAEPVKLARKSSIDIQDRHLSGFNAVSVEASFDVYITQGNSESVKVEADDDELDRIITEVKNGVLKIRNKSNKGMNWSWGDKKRIIHITARNINSISLSGSGDVYFKNGIRTSDLALRLSGSGDVSGKIEAKTVRVSVSGSGDIKLSGRAETSTIEMSGSGDYSARNLETVNSAVRVSGSGDVTVNVSHQLDASVNGSGDVHYTGSAKIINTKENGSGDISRI
jgi:hypothetical protein